MSEYISEVTLVLVVLTLLLLCYCCRQHHHHHRELMDKLDKQDAPAMVMPEESIPPSPAVEETDTDDGGDGGEA
jgi:hypothetical protein